jgi:uncharacterized damage-inducible protein DinB
MVASIRLTPADARTLSAYNREVFDRFARKVRRLPKKAAFRRRGIGHESLFDTLVHVLNVHECWIFIADGRVGELDALFQDPSRHPKDWAGFNVYARKVWAGVDAYLARATPKRLSRRVRTWWMPGVYTARDGLMQATFEQAHHLGEIIGALWQDDRPSPPMTWIEVGRAVSARRR